MHSVALPCDEDTQKTTHLSIVLTNPLNSWPLQKHMAQIAFMEHIYGLLFSNNPAEISCKFRRFALLKTSHNNLCVMYTGFHSADLNSINWSKGCKIEPHCTYNYLKLPVVWSYNVDHLLCYRHRRIIMSSLTVGRLTEIRVPTLHTPQPGHYKLDNILSKPTLIYYQEREKLERQILRERELTGNM